MPVMPNAPLPSQRSRSASHAQHLAVLLLGPARELLREEGDRVEVELERIDLVLGEVGDAQLAVPDGVAALRLDLALSGERCVNADS